MPSLASPVPSVRPISYRIARYKELQKLIQPVPADWLGTPRDSGVTAVGSSIMQCLPCTSYAQLVKAWRRAIKWTDGLDCALSVMLASAMSTKFVGEQLWIKILGPPSCGKTTVVEGLAVNTEYVLSKDSIRGFYSGWKKEGGEDNALIVLARDKTLVTKDGDTLLKAPNFTQILSEARGIYDRSGRTHYRNNQMDDYLGYRMTWLLCGTNALREIDDSELGARFIDCVVMDEIDDDFEDDVGWRAANQEDRNMLLESNGSATSDHSPELAEAMALTGGYVGYLRRNALELSSEVTASEFALRRCSRLGKFVAFMRARPSRKDDDEPTREFSPRLVKQHVRIARMLAAVMNRRELDDEVMRRVTKVAFDTARGQTLKLTDHLYRAQNGLEARALEVYTGIGNEKLRKMLRFIQKIGVTEQFDVEIAGKMTAQRRYKLTPRIHRLYSEIER